MKKLIFLAALVLTTTLPALAADDNNWFLRFGAVTISPNDDSGPVLGNDGVGVDSDTQIGFNLTYMLDDNWGIEVLGANPFTHKISGDGTLRGVPIGRTDHLPPTFSAVYNFDTDGDTIYHVGAGLNYTKFFEDYASPEIQAALGASVDLDLSASTGLSLKAGFDTPIGDNWYFSGGLYYIMIDTEADVIVNGSVATVVDVDINPWVFMLGFGTSF